MKIVCLMPVRNEDWILGLSARAVLQWADELVILDHASTDGSPDIEMELAEEYPDRVVIVSEFHPRWEEMRHRQRLLETARARKATHMALIDADEIVSANLAPEMRAIFERMPTKTVMQLPWLALRGSINRFHSSGPWADHQNVSSGFVDSPELHWAARNGYDFHHRHPMGRPMIAHMPLGPRHPHVKVRGGVLHLQFVSGRRLRAKQYLYQLTERLRWPDREPVEMVKQRYSLAVYGRYVAPSPEQVDDIDRTMSSCPPEWWTGYEPLMEHLKPHAEPWQFAECARLLKEHPGIEKGLDDFGLFFEPFYNRGIISP